MNKFSWYDALTVEDALQQVNSTLSEELYNPSSEAAIFKSGGVDLLDWIKEGLLNPQTIINIRNIPGLDQITWDDEEGMIIGANVTLASIGDNDTIENQYPALHQAIHHAATPQLRNMSTLGGNIAQRTRCWYFRSSDHPCFRKGGDRCFARHSDSGQNENHAILDNGSCVSVHASSIATALMAYGANVHVTLANGDEKVIPMDEFFVSPGQDPSKENVLKSKELITAIQLPARSNSTKSYYMKHVARESYDWSLGDVAIVVEMDGTICRQARVVLGAAAPTPHRATAAEQFLVGKSINPENAQEAANLAMENARPLSKNEYKIPLFINLVRNGLLNLA